MTGAAAGDELEEADEKDVGSRLSVKARRVLARGRAAVKDLPKPDRVAAMDEAERHDRLEALRVELYAISSVLAEGTVDRAIAARDERPPYGLVRSGHTDWKMVLANPKTVEEGEVEDFYGLGKAYVDTMVFHLDREFAEIANTEKGWLVPRLESLLALFRVSAGPAAKARMRDPLSFIYGGLHFGTSVSVQLAEVMNLVLDEGPWQLSPDAKADVMRRSSRPALRLAALNLDHVIVTYHELLAPAEVAGGPQWFDGDRFAVQESSPGQPHSIDFRPDLLAAGKPHVATADAIRPTWATHGCPARVSPAGVAPPITKLWTWGVDLALQTGLLGGPTDGQPATESPPGGH